jgi:ComF family protein
LRWYQKYTEGFISLFYPKFCFACGNALFGNEKVICTFCMHNLPETNYHLFSDNPVEQLFWGRIKAENASSFLFYEKSSKYGHLLHEFKYKGYTEIGLFLGQLFGSRLKDTAFKDIDIIVPIPLHKAKYRSRGFNQSEVFGNGLAMPLGKPVVTDALARNIFTSTQTRRGRFERWENVEGIFKVKNTELLKNKHVLLIDDVVTTGATIEAAGIEILKCEGCKLSIATMAFAHLT